jgi:DNA excision repair protein ERCC-4
MLPFADAVASQMHKHRDCLIVLGRGFSVPKITASYLYTKYSSALPQKYSPYLIFLLNFDEVDFSALTLDMQTLQRNSSLSPITMTQLTAKDLLKRNEMFLRGGVFSVTYKQLVVDLLCKKVSPLIITGIIVNQAHECDQKESFILKLVKQANPKAFVKAMTDRAAIVRQGGIQRLQEMMTSLYVDKLVLLPRISKAVNESLNVSNLKVEEHSLIMTDTMKEMHQLLIEIMQACLEEAKAQYAMINESKSKRESVDRLLTVE